jgi:hypothetical protein
VYEPAAKSDGVPSLKCVAWPGKKTAVKGWSLGGWEAEAPYDAWDGLEYCEGEAEFFGELYDVAAGAL